MGKDFAGGVYCEFCIWCIRAFSQLSNDVSFIKIVQDIQILQWKKDPKVFFSALFSECFHLRYSKVPLSTRCSKWQIYNPDNLELRLLLEFQVVCILKFKWIFHVCGWNMSSCLKACVYWIQAQYHEVQKKKNTYNI